MSLEVIKQGRNFSSIRNGELYHCYWFTKPIYYGAGREYFLHITKVRKVKFLGITFNLSYWNYTFRIGEINIFVYCDIKRNIETTYEGEFFKKSFVIDQLSKGIESYYYDKESSDRYKTSLKRKLKHTDKI